MDTEMTLLALLALLAVLHVPAALSAALATAQQPCPPGQFFNSKLSLCDFCPVPPDQPTEQQLLHHQQQCRNHPACCRAADGPGTAPPRGSATSPSAGEEHPASHHATSLPPTDGPSGRSRFPTGVIVAIFVAAGLVIVILVVAAAVVLALWLGSRRGPHRKSPARGGPTITNLPVERNNPCPYEQVPAAQAD